MNVETRLKQALQEQMPLGQLAYEKVSGQTVDLLTEYFMLLGFKIPDMQELTLLARKVTDDLYESYSYLRMEEVAVCFELGAKGDFGEYVGLNWRTITRWLKSYKTCDKRLKAKQELEEEARRREAPKPDPEKERWHETHFLLTVFDFYKTRLQDPGDGRQHQLPHQDLRGVGEARRAALLRTGEAGGDSAVREPGAEKEKQRPPHPGQLDEHGCIVACLRVPAQEVF